MNQSYISQEILKEVTITETKRVIKAIQKNDTTALINIIRRVDVVLMYYLNNSPGETNQPERLATIKYFEYGWSKAIKIIFDKLTYSQTLTLEITDNRLVNWSDNIIIHLGIIGVTEQLLDYVKSKLMDISGPKKNTFYFNFSNDYSVIDAESFDRESFNFYKNILIKKIIEDKKKEYKPNLLLLEHSLKNIIKNPLGKFISYETTQDLDYHYSKLGYFHMLSIQNFDDFSDDDIFGGIEYKKFLDVIQEIIGTALLHNHACIYLLDKNPEVNIHNIISYMCDPYKLKKNLAIYLNIKQEEIEKIFTCITLSLDNYSEYLNIPYCPLPMFIQISEKQVVRTTFGCLSNPLTFLKFQLKKKFSNDYFLAVNKREDRFRKDIFNLFDHDNIIKIPNGVNIKYKGIATDIDLVLYDVSTSTLGLFQLKWPDPFSHSMKERRSKISNLFPKANEWINKIYNWIETNDEKTIINSLQLKKHYPYVKTIENIYVFVLSRNNINFTGAKMDSRAAWASWYQVIESFSKVETTFNDPIKEMYLKLKFYNPTNVDNRKNQYKIKNDILTIGKYRLKFKHK